MNADRINLNQQDCFCFYIGVYRRLSAADSCFFELSSSRDWQNHG